MIPGAAQSIRRLATEGIRIRIITHRLFIRHFHETAVAQTVRWLDSHGLPYWDLCFMKEKGHVGANVYVEDSPDNILKLRKNPQTVVIIFDNSTNRHLPDTPGGRATTWTEAERIIRGHYYSWLAQRGLSEPPGPGLKPSWFQ